MGSLVPTAVAAHALGVTPDAIRMMRRRGKLTRHGSKQKALVDLDELATLIEQRDGFKDEERSGHMKRSDIADEHVLALARSWRDNPFRAPGVIDALQAEGIPPKLALAKVEHMCARGLLTYGVSPRYAWPL